MIDRAVDVSAGRGSAPLFEQLAHRRRGDAVMSAWTEDELRRIGDAEELEIAPVRAPAVKSGSGPAASSAT